MFCYKCGKEAPLTDGLCAACYASEHSLLELKERYDITACKTCDSFQMEEWMPFSHVEDIIERIIQKEAGKARVVFVEDFSDPTHECIQCAYGMTYCDEYWLIESLFLGYDDPFSEIPIREEHDFELHFKFTVCPSCSKKYGGYYEAVLQIRREGRFLTKEEKNLFLSEVTRLSEAELESYNMAFITQVLPKKEGIDFQMGSLKVTKKIARALQSAYGGTIAESHRLAGFDRQAGKERYRTTVVLRLSVFEAGLFVLYDGRLWKVADALDKLLLRNFSEERAIDFKKVEKEHTSGALEIIDKKALRPGMIASRDAEGAELLTLDSYETLPLAPELVVSGMDQGEQVLFFTRDGTHYAVSP